MTSGDEPLPGFSGQATTKVPYKAGGIDPSAQQRAAVYDGTLYYLLETDGPPAGQPLPLLAPEDLGEED